MYICVRARVYTRMYVCVTCRCAQKSPYMPIDFDLDSVVLWKLSLPGISWKSSVCKICFVHIINSFFLKKKSTFRNLKLFSIMGGKGTTKDKRLKEWKMYNKDYPLLSRPEIG